ncbi:MAG: hypothetical protein JSW12_14725 [Deltaproteobacteria bacterium]|nr:MAG: hypothetical protein JSW12_14725 [Deltaproteobacteria bacterium]
MNQRRTSTRKRTRIKAVGLLSGGLDSTLAAKLMLEQKIEVYAINFTSPFCTCTPKKAGCASVVTAVKELGGIPLTRVALGNEYLEIVRNPKHGYGSEMNPCIDCRIIKVRKAGEYMRDIGASFLFTGEVLGQRPMSQRRAVLKLIDRESGFEGSIVRPLSARLLPPAIPEKEGWLERERLLGFRSRSRKPQMALAVKYGIVDYPCPAGGCLLTDPGFARRMKDLMTYSELTVNDTELLKVGRHFRLMPQAKLVVGRNKEENERLLGLAKRDDICFSPIEVKGPIGIGRGNLNREHVQKSVGIMARYCDGGTHGKVKITNRRLPNGKPHVISTMPMQEDNVAEFRI